MSWWRNLPGRSGADAQLDAELRDHIERLVAQYMDAGMSEPDARRRARFEFGGMDQVKEMCRDVRRTRILDELVQDVRYGARVFRKNPAFMLTAVVSLALGIGANTAIFSLIDATMLRPLPVTEPDRLLELLTDRRGPGPPGNAFSYQALGHFRDHATTVDIIASHTSSFFVAIDNAAPELGTGQYVTGNFFPVLGVPALHGRIVQPADDRPGAAAVAVLSHAYWRRRFGGDLLAVGHRVRLDDHLFTVVGIAPRSFRGLVVGREVDFWIPLSTEPLVRKESRMADAGHKWLQLAGRLNASSLEQARAELESLFQTGVVEEEIRLARKYGQDPDRQQRARRWRLSIEPARAGLAMVRQQYAEPLLVLLAISGLVLMIACVNVANLLLARGSSRRHELAVRLSLGAGRPRVMRQLLTESMLLAFAGAALGIALAYAGSQYLVALLETRRAAFAVDVGPDPRVLAFTGTLAVATGLLFGLAPAWRATAQAPAAWLSATGRVHGGGDRRVLSRMLIGSQVALSVVMLFCAGLFLRSLHNIRSVDAGFDSGSVLLINTEVLRNRVSPEAERTMLRSALGRLSAVPGVQAASLSHITPIFGGGTERSVEIEGERGAAPREARAVPVNWVSPGYFATMGTPIHSGRDFTWQDTTTSPKVAIINLTMARRYFANESAIGKRLALGDVAYEIVAIAGDAKYLELREATPPTIYFNVFQLEDRLLRIYESHQFAARTRERPLAAAATARDALRTVAPSMAVTRVRTLQEQVDLSIGRERMLSVLSGYFAGLGLLLVAVGLYGVMAYTVARRTSEIGVRIALGAKPARIAGMIMREALVITAGGIAAGMLAAQLLSRGLARLLFGLTPSDPLTVCGVTAIMVTTGLAAAYLPGRRAARLDPTTALRIE